MGENTTPIEDGWRALAMHDLESVKEAIGGLRVSIAKVDEASQQRDRELSAQLGAMADRGQERHDTLSKKLAEIELGLTTQLLTGFGGFQASIGELRQGIHPRLMAFQAVVSLCTTIGLALWIILARK